MEIDRKISSFPERVRDEMRMMIRSLIKDKDLFTELFKISRSSFMIEDFIRYISDLEHYYVNEEEWDNLVDENEYHKTEIDQLKRELERKDKAILTLREKPFLRDKKLHDYVLTYMMANERLPSFEEVWKQATLITEEKFEGICGKYQECARTQHCKENHEDCFEKRDT